MTVHGSWTVDRLVDAYTHHQRRTRGLRPQTWKPPCDIIHVAAATRRAVLVAGSSKGLSAFGPRPDGSRPARGDTWLQLRRSSAAAGSRSLDAY